MNLSGRIPSFFALTICLFCFHTLMKTLAPGTGISDGILHFIEIWLPITFLLFSAIHIILNHRTDHIRLDRYTYGLLVFVPLLLGVSDSSNLEALYFPVFIGFVFVIKILHLVVSLPGFLERAGNDRVRYLILFVTALTVLAPLAGWNTLTQPLDGDEPFFLLLTHSLINDGDMNLENNYLNQDSLDFSDRVLEPQKWDDYENGRLLSRHTAALPIFLIPGFFFAGRMGAVLSITGLTAVLGILIFIAVHRFTDSMKSAVMVFSLFIFTAPLLFYSHQIYAEIPGALFGMSAILLADNIRQKKRGMILPAILLIIVAAWFKTRLIVLCFPVIAVGVLLRKSSGAALVRILLIFSGLLLILGVFNTVFYGSPLVRYEMVDILGTSPLRIIRGILGQVWDAQYGIIPLNPIMLMAFAGIPILIRRAGRDRTLIWSAAIIPYFMLVSAYAELIGGICPRGRFLTAWLPLMAIPMGYALSTLRNHFIRVFFWCLTSFTILLNLIFFINPTFRSDIPGFANTLTDHLSAYLSLDLIGFLPLFDRVDPDIWIQGIVFAGITLVLSVIVLKVYNANSHPTFEFSPQATFLILGCIGLIPMISGHSGSWWAQSEDRTFNKINSKTFWEEPYQWDRVNSLEHPYRAGTILSSGSILERVIPMKSRGNLLHVIARGIITDRRAPRIRAEIAGKTIGTCRIRSDSFESYWFQIPENTDAVPFRLLSDYPDDGSSVIIDCVRLEYGPDNRVAATHTPDKLLPVSFNRSRILDFQVLTHEFVQNEPLIIRMTTDISPSEKSQVLIIRLRENHRVYDYRINKFSSQPLELQIDVPPELGSGEFQVLIGMEHDGQIIPPTGYNIFRVADFAYQDHVTLSPAVMPSTQEDDRLLQTQFPELSISVLNHAFHLGEDTSLNIPLDGPVTAHGIVFLSNITHLFEVIPFENRMAEITLYITGKSPVTLPVLIGRHTAEEMYFFPSGKVKLPHPVPVVARSLDTIVAWPPPLEGMHYPATTYSAYIPFPETVNIQGIRFNTLNFAGTLNCYSIGLVTE